MPRVSYREATADNRIGLFYTHESAVAEGAASHMVGKPKSAPNWGQVGGQYVAVLGSQSPQGWQRTNYSVTTSK